MDRINSQNVDTTLGYRRFKDGPPGTTVNADWLTAMQEEIINCIKSSGQLPSQSNLGQLWAAILSASAASALPVGAMMLYGSAAAPPQGWLLCDGSIKNQSDYGALYGAIGTTFNTGGEGVGTFRLPDFRGVFPKGAGTTTRAAGVDASGNAYAATLGAYAQDQVQGHKHTYKMGNNSSLTGYIERAGAGGLGQTTDEGMVGIEGDGVNGNVRAGHTTEPQSVGVGFIIKY